MGDASVGTVTVLFTDLVDSTGLLQHGADTADEIRRTHFDDVGGSIASHRGVVVKNTGDGIMATFAAAGDAVAAAEVIQQVVDHRRRGDPRTRQVRVGIASGEASHEDDDWFGPPVILAARLCAVAPSGGILATDLVRMLVEGRGDHRFADPTPIELKGFDQAVVVTELQWDRWAPPDLPTPAVAARSSPGAAFVGRTAELDRLLGSWKEAQGGARIVELVGGEPGMGKTRLLGELAGQVHGSAGLVLWGRCDDDAVIPYQPWVELLRQALGTAASRPLLAAYPPLEVLLPELGDGGRARTSSTLTPPGADGEQDRRQLFDAVAGAIADLAQDGPLLIVIDDLHWAARPSLLLLRHVIRERVDGGVLIVASYRDNEIDRQHPMADLLADLGRDEAVRRCPIGGLDQAAVLDLVREAFDVGDQGGDADQHDQGGAASLAQAVHLETKGNPFFVGQVLSHLAELEDVDLGTSPWNGLADLAELGVPDGVREVIGRRLARLSDAANRALTVAAVVGAEFDLEMLEAVPDASEPGRDVLDALDESLGARLIEEVDAAPGRYRSAHALVRQTLLTDLSGARRARLHRHVAEAIAARPRPDPAALAGHWCAGATAGTVDNALFWSAVAADAAITGLASEEAISLLERAFVAAELDPDPDHRMLAGMWLLMAAAHQWIGETDPAKRAADRAAGEARLADDAELLARAAVQRAGWAVAGTFDHLAGDLIVEALDRLGPDRPDLRSRLLAALALHRAVNENQGLDAFPLSEEATALARQVGDPELLSMVLGSAVIMHVAGPDIDEQDRIVAELEALGPQLRNLYETSDNRVTAQRTRVVLDMQRGDTERSRQRALEDTGIYPAMVAIWRGMHELFAGRFAEAEAENQQVAPYVGTDLNFRNSAAGHLFRIRREQGRLAEVLPVLAGSASRARGLTALQTMHAVALIDVDDLAPAREILDRLAPDGFVAVPSDTILPACLADLAEVTARTGDADMAAALHDRLRPFSGQLLVVSWGVACLGAADRYLAMLEGMLGRRDEAEAHLAAALQLEEHAGGGPAMARTRLAWGELLVQHGLDHDRSRARTMLDETVESAELLGMPGVVARASALLDG